MTSNQSLMIASEVFSTFSCNLSAYAISLATLLAYRDLSSPFTGWTSSCHLHCHLLTSLNADWMILFLWDSRSAEYPILSSSACSSSGISWQQNLYAGNFLSLSMTPRFCKIFSYLYMVSARFTSASLLRACTAFNFFLSNFCFIWTSTLGCCDSD